MIERLHQIAERPGGERGPHRLGFGCGGEHHGVEADLAHQLHARAVGQVDIDQGEIEGGPLDLGAGGGQGVDDRADAESR